MNNRPANRQGRKKGVPNKRTETIKSMLERIGCDPIEGMAKIALGQTPCQWCKTTGKVPVIRHFELLGRKIPDWAYDPSKAVPNSFEVHAIAAERLMKCPKCIDGLEVVDITLRGKMLAEIAQYVEPKRKAIEVSAGMDGPRTGEMSMSEAAQKTKILLEMALDLENDENTGKTIQ